MQQFIMQQFIETKVTYDKTLENGVMKQVCEPYLVEAMSFTEAEARITEALKPYMVGEFNVSAVRRSNIAEVWPRHNGDVSAADGWYKVKIAFISVNERTMCEKRANTTYLVQGVSVAEALDSVNYYMRDTMADYEVEAIAKTNIVEVING